MRLQELPPVALQPQEQQPFFTVGFSFRSGLKKINTGKQIPILISTILITISNSKIKPVFQIPTKSEIENQESQIINLLIIPKSFQHIRVASPVFIHFHHQFDMDLFPKEFF